MIFFSPQTLHLVQSYDALKKQLYLRKNKEKKEKEKVKENDFLFELNFSKIKEMNDRIFRENHKKDGFHSGIKRNKMEISMIENSMKNKRINETLKRVLHYTKTKTRIDTGRISIKNGFEDFRRKNNRMFSEVLNRIKNIGKKN